MQHYPNARGEKYHQLGLVHFPGKYVPFSQSCSSLGIHTCGNWGAKPKCLIVFPYFPRFYSNNKVAQSVDLLMHLKNYHVLKRVAHIFGLTVPER